MILNSPILESNLNDHLRENIKFASFRILPVTRETISYYEQVRVIIIKGFNKLDPHAIPFTFQFKAKTIHS
jgi:hypothetical protein